MVDSRVLLAAEVNALPERVKNYIMWLETEADPAGTISNNWHLTQENKALRILAAELEKVRQALWDMARQGNPAVSTFSAAIIRELQLDGPAGEDPEDA